MIHKNLYLQIINLDNLFAAYREFRRGKRNKKEVAEFEINLEENIFALHNELEKFYYKHSKYTCFKISDPKPRIIHKAQIKDRVVHQAVYRILYPLFEKTFIFDSYASRLKKGTHRAVRRLTSFVYRVSQNYKIPCYAVKIDIEKFFYNIDHSVLSNLLKKKISCPQTIWLVEKILESFSTKQGKGLPLGNVTSQFFANVYLDPLDKFVKNNLQEKFYLRFCDDLMIVKPNPDFTFSISQIGKFLAGKLLLKIKTAKLKVRKLPWGFDYLGYVVLPHHLILRPKTRKRMLGNIEKRRQWVDRELITEEKFAETLNSYLGLLKHCDSNKLEISLQILWMKKIVPIPNLKDRSSQNQFARPRK